MGDIDLTNLADLHEESQIFYQRVRSTVINLSTRTRKGEFNIKELADIGFLLREVGKQFEEIRKDVDANKNLIDKIFCIKVMEQTLQDPTKDEIIRTERCSATPVYKKSCTLPPKDTPEYVAMQIYFGINERGREMGTAKVSWREVCKHVTQLCELGKPIPNFIPKIFDDYTVTHRRK